MKKILVSIVAMVFAIPTFAQFSSGGFDLDKESMYYGVRIGMVGANLTGDAEATGMKIGLSLGGVIGIRISHTTPLFLESGLYYVGRGGKDGDFSVGYNNLEIPLLIKYGVKAGDIAFLPFFGPYFAYGISGKTMKLGCGLEFNKLYVEAGYQFGLSNITKHADNSVHSNALFLNVGVNF